MKTLLKVGLFLAAAILLVFLASGVGTLQREYRDRNHPIKVAYGTPNTKAWQDWQALRQFRKENAEVHGREYIPYKDDPPMPKS